ncbi:MAG: hypothetical protein EP302_10535 [Bacteroidetes bacterium]|nr:MAG: hypothetical protein EP302_10535 [Bacteroidota bacterium]
MNQSFSAFAWRMTALHMITYFIAGILAVNLMDYETLFRSGGLEHYMHPTDTPMVALGPGLQWIRGLIFALVLWPFRDTILSENRGWLKLWGLFVGLGILATFGPALGSVDGLIYTKIPMAIQTQALPELIIQSLLLSAGLWWWYKYPRKWITIVSIVLVALIVFMSIAGYQFLQMQPQ